MEKPIVSPIENETKLKTNVKHTIPRGPTNRHQRGRLKFVQTRRDKTTPKKRHLSFLKAYERGTPNDSARIDNGSSDDDC